MAAAGDGCQPICSQEVKHAPTVEQSRADQKLWLSKLTGGPGTNELADVSFKELTARHVEMFDCLKVDPKF